MQHAQQNPQLWILLRVQAGRMDAVGVKSTQEILLRAVQFCKVSILKLIKIPGIHKEFLSQTHFFHAT